MLTPSGARINDFIPGLVRGDHDPLHDLVPAWTANYPAIEQKILDVDEAFRTTIALFGADAAAELPKPMFLRRLLNGQYSKFRGLAATAYQRLEERSNGAKNVWDVAEEEVLSSLAELDELRRNLLRDLKELYGKWSWVTKRRPREEPHDFLDELDGTLSRVQEMQRALLEPVERAAKIVEDWIVTVRSVALPSIDEQQLARRDLLAELRRTFPDSIAGTRVQQTIDDGIEAALDAHDVVVMGELTFDTATRRYLASKMEMLAQQDIGAVLAQVPRELQPVLDRFAVTRNRVQLLSDLQSAGIGGGDALADMAAAAADHDVRVVAFDTRWGHRAEPGQVQIKNHYMAAVATQTLQQLPEGKKIVALVNVEHTSSSGDVDDLTGGASFLPRQPDGTLPAGSVAYHQGGNAFGDEATFVYAPQR